MLKPAPDSLVYARFGAICDITKGFLVNFFRIVCVWNDERAKWEKDWFLFRVHWELEKQRDRHILLLENTETDRLTDHEASKVHKDELFHMTTRFPHTNFFPPKKQKRSKRKHKMRNKSEINRRPLFVFFFLEMN